MTVSGECMLQEVSFELVLFSFSICFSVFLFFLDSIAILTLLPSFQFYSYQFELMFILSSVG